MMRITVLAGAAATIILMGVAMLNGLSGPDNTEMANPVSVERTATRMTYNDPHTTVKAKTQTRE